MHFITSRRRLVRKKMYKPSINRKNNSYFRENKNLVKSHQENFKNKEFIRKIKRPKREVSDGFKMAYRYRYYNSIDELIKDDFDD
ncbi:hypothetical protein [Methanobrevibacter oralis]|uniref:Uncharacterized protein n=1 Tax=Methanobrevibacter oralis TaxID=66851 RepID=A0A166CCR8_METOA|nr:hypothetical protein [Methanobrevibacter oralis]KZX13217.1 hypothetical protein MBORA_08220 [Methanobrevibacter oralis]